MLRLLLLLLPKRLLLLHPPCEYKVRLRTLSRSLLPLSHPHLHGTPTRLYSG